MGIRLLAMIFLIGATGTPIMVGARIDAASSPPTAAGPESLPVPVIALNEPVDDNEPPTGTILINNNDAFATHPTVNLTLAAGDNVGVTQMRFSHDGHWRDWLAYATSHKITLTGRDGPTWIQVQYRDAAGNTSDAFHDDIVLDTAPPVSAVAALPPILAHSFRVSWSGADSTSGVSCYDVQFRDEIDGAWTDWYSCTTSAVALFQDATGGHTYYFRSRAHDRAGNWESYPAGPDYDTYTTIEEPPAPPPPLSHRVFLAIVVNR